jgi:hypothetical protein
MRKGQFGSAKPYTAFPTRFCYLALAIATPRASSRPLEYPVVFLRSRLFGPSQLLTGLQCHSLRHLPRPAV